MPPRPARQKKAGSKELFWRYPSFGLRGPLSQGLTCLSMVPPCFLLHVCPRWLVGTAVKQILERVSRNGQRARIANSVIDCFNAGEVGCTAHRLCWAPLLASTSDIFRNTRAYTCILPWESCTRAPWPWPSLDK